MKIKFPDLKVAHITIVSVVLVLGFIFGWSIRGKILTGKAINIIPALRLEGYKFISPLLICDNSADKESPELEPLKNKLNNIIDKEISEKNVTNVSVYFRDLKNGSQLNINKEEKFYPASLVKIPVMIAYFKLAENDPSILSKKITFSRDQDENLTQEIKPKDYLKPKEAYTIEEMIEKMIKYSDNNAYTVLIGNIDQNILKSVYEDLQAPFLFTMTDSNRSNPEKYDFMTTNKYSYFFRVLYNGTYLNREYSEKALKILSEADFKDGLASGIPEDISIAHKFGLTSISPDGLSISSRELHDCGIIYHFQNQYLLCVMTKSVSSIQNIEKAIKDISTLVYQEVENQYQ